MAIKGGRGMRKRYPNVTKWPVDCTIPKWVSEELRELKNTKRHRAIDQYTIKN